MVLGVFALMAWRPGRLWVLIGTAFAAMTVGGAIYAVQGIEGTYVGGGYDFLWSASAVLIAYAAWRPSPGEVEPREVFGWQAIALPVAAQALSGAIQVYGLFHEIPRSERIVTFVVLAIATMQIIVSRPQRSPEQELPP